MTRWRYGVALAAITLALGSGTAAAQGARGDSTGAAVQALQTRILNDPQLAGQVHSLSDDPRVREILADPTVAEALNRGDFNALLANPKIHELADHPAMRGLAGQVVPAK